MHLNESRDLYDLLANVGEALSEMRTRCAGADAAFNRKDVKQAAVGYNSACGTAEGALEEVQRVLSEMTQKQAA